MNISGLHYIIFHEYEFDMFPFVGGSWMYMLLIFNAYYLGIFLSKLYRIYADITRTSLARPTNIKYFLMWCLQANSSPAAREFHWLAPAALVRAYRPLLERRIAMVHIYLSCHRLLSEDVAFKWRIVITDLFSMCNFKYIKARYTSVLKPLRWLCCQVVYVTFLRAGEDGPITAAYDYRVD